MPKTFGRLFLDPGGVSTVVTLTGPAGGNLVAYTAADGASTHSFPETISTLTGYYFTNERPLPVTVSAKVNGVESANDAGGTITVIMDRGVGETRAIGISSSEVATAIAGLATLATSTTLAEGINIIVGTTTGSQIATGATQKLGFYGATPVVQPAALTQTYATADGTLATPTAAAVSNTATTPAPAGGTGATGGAYDTAGHRDTAIAAINALETDVTALVTQYTALRADVLDLAQFVNSAVDKLQALGLLS